MNRPAVTVTFFSDYTATSKVEQNLPLDRLADLIRTRSAARKERLPWLKLARFGDERTPARSLRHDRNVLAITGIEADYDGEQETFDAACEVLEKQGISSIVYTSPSHTEDAPRWRVLCPFSAEMEPGKRDHQLGRLNGLFGAIFAHESWTLSQSFYFGRVNDNPSHQVEVIHGTSIDQHDDLDEIWRGKPGHNAAGRIGERANKEPREDAELIRCIISAEHFHIELCALAARYIARGIPPGTVSDILSGIMLSHPEGSRDGRWYDRYYSIPALVASAQHKFHSELCQQTKPARRELARMARCMFRECRPSKEVIVAVLKRAGELELPERTARDIVQWAARQELAGRASADG